MRSNAFRSRFRSPGTQSVYREVKEHSPSLAGYPGSTTRKTTHEIRDNRISRRTCARKLDDTGSGSWPGRNVRRYGRNVNRNHDRRACVGRRNDRSVQARRHGQSEYAGKSLRQFADQRIAERIDARSNGHWFRHPQIAAHHLTKKSPASCGAFCFCATGRCDFDSDAINRRPAQPT